MTEYTKCIADSLKLFYQRLDDHLKECEALDIQSNKNKINEKDKILSEVRTYVSTSLHFILFYDDILMTILFV